MKEDAQKKNSQRPQTPEALFLIKKTKYKEGNREEHTEQNVQGVGVRGVGGGTLMRHRGNEGRAYIQIGYEDVKQGVSVYQS